MRRKCSSLVSIGFLLSLGIELAVAQIGGFKCSIRLSPSHCIDLVTDPVNLSWVEASRHCLRHNASLVHVRDEAKRKAVAALMANASATTAWIGDADFDFKTEGVLEPAYIVDNTSLVADDQLTASSEFYSVPIWYAKDARLSKRGWYPKKPYDKKQWIQVDFRNTVCVHGVVTKAVEPYPHWVTSYKVKYGFHDGCFTEKHEEGDIFQGNNDSQSLAYVNFTTPFTARYVRLNPQSWKDDLGMRFDLHVTDGECQSYERSQRKRCPSVNVANYSLLFWIEDCFKAMPFVCEFEDIHVAPTTTIETTEATTEATTITQVTTHLPSQPVQEGLKGQNRTISIGVGIALGLMSLVCVGLAILLFMTCRRTRPKHYPDAAPRDRENLDFPVNNYMNGNDEKQTHGTQPIQHNILPNEDVYAQVNKETKTSKVNEKTNNIKEVNDKAPLHMDDHKDNNDYGQLYANVGYDATNDQPIAIYHTEMPNTKTSRGKPQTGKDLSKGKGANKDNDDSGAVYALAKDNNQSHSDIEFVNNDIYQS